MFPSKDLDVGEIQKLFRKTRTMDGDTTFLAQSPFQSSMANRSSSSAESTSPESYHCPTTSYLNMTRPETPKHTFDTPKLSYESPTYLNRRYGSLRNFETSLDNNYKIDTLPAYEPLMSAFESPNSRLGTPLQTRHQYPIVGRKILGRNSQPKFQTKFENETELSWQMEPLAHSPPEMQKNYELFPSERGFQFSSPIESQNTSQKFNQGQKPITPMTTPNFVEMGDQRNWSPMAQPNFTIPYNPPTNLAGSSNEVGQSKMCTFCRKNGETPVVYMTHCVKEKLGNKYVVKCPILRSHVCSICGLSGDEAHTITYCPVLRKTNDGKPLQSTTITLKNTRIKSNGRRRY